MQCADRWSDIVPIFHKQCVFMGGACSVTDFSDQSRLGAIKVRN